MPLTEIAEFIVNCNLTDSMCKGVDKKATGKYPGRIFFFVLYPDPAASA